MKNAFLLFVMHRPRILFLSFLQNWSFMVLFFINLLIVPFFLISTQFKIVFSILLNWIINNRCQLFMRYLVHSQIVLLKKCSYEYNKNMYSKNVWNFNRYVGIKNNHKTFNFFFNNCSIYLTGKNSQKSVFSFLH